MRPSSSRRQGSSENLQASDLAIDTNDARTEYLQASEVPANASVDELFSLFIGLAAAVHIPASLNKSNWLENLVNKDVGVSNMHSRYVGSGASFTVRSLRCDNPEPSLALKSAMPSNYRFTHRDEKRRLADIILELRALSHPPLQGHRNIIELLGLAWETDSHDQLRKWPVLIIEHADGGTLHDLLRKEVLTEREKLNACFDIACGINALHSCGIIHGDVKPQNVLMVQACSSDEAQVTWIAKIGDFGGAIMDAVDGGLGNLRTPSQPWNAPEWMNRLSPRELMQTDVYSLGLVFWNIASNGVNPFTEYADCLGLPDPNRDTQEYNRAVQKLKLDGTALLQKLDDPGAQSFASDVNPGTIKHLLSITVQRDSEQRNLSEVLKCLTDVLHDGRRPSTFMLEQKTRTIKAEQMALDTLEEASSKPIEMDTLDPIIRSYTVNRLGYTALSGSERWQKASAAFTLASEALASGVDAQRMTTCLKWLVRAAELGHVYARSLAYRFYNAFDVAIPVPFLPRVKDWTLDASLKGYPGAQEDLSALLSPEDLQQVRLKFRFRYAGIGRNRFSACYLDDSTTAKEWDVKWSAHIQHLLRSDFEDDGLQVNDSGDTILHFAACAGLQATVEMWLVMRPADVDHRGQYLETPLLHACRSGHYNVACVLMEAGADPRIPSLHGDTPLHWILSFDTDKLQDITSKLLTRGSDPNATAKRLFFASAPEVNYEAGTPLHRAVGRGNLEAVRTLVHQGASAAHEGCRADRSTPLNLAAMFQCPEILETLLDSLLEQKPARRVFGGMSLLINAIKGEIIYGNAFEKIARHKSLSDYRTKAIRCLDILLQRGAINHLQKMPDESIGFGSSALFIAIPYGDLQVIKYLLLQPNVSSIINSKCTLKLDYTPTTPLNRALNHRRLDVFHLLLHHGANATALHVNENGTELTYLYQCAVDGHADASFAQELILRGVQVDAGPAKYETPFACAVRNRCFKLATFLLEQGANPNIEFSEGLMFKAELAQTLLAYLIQEQSLSVLSCLDYLFGTIITSSEHGPISFFTSKNGNMTVLHKIARVREHGRDDLACKLILLRVLDFFKPTKEQIDMLDADGLTALAYAANEANVGVVTLLLQWGADPLAEGPRGLESSALYILLKKLYMLDHSHQLADFVDDQDARPNEVQLATAKRRRTAIEHAFRSLISEDDWINFIDEHNA